MEARLTPQVLAMYLGCEVQTSKHYTETLTGLTTKSSDGLGTVRIQTYDKDFDFIHFYDFDEVKPILRRLSSMTEEEANQLLQNKYYNPRDVYDHVEAIKVDNGGIFYCGTYPSTGRKEYNHWLFWHKLEAKDFAWLLSKHFDLFGLIDSGLAIDSATLKK